MEPTAVPLPVPLMPSIISSEVEGHQLVRDSPRSTSFCGLWSEGNSDRADYDQDTDPPPPHTPAFLDFDEDPGCIGNKGRRYPFKVKFDDRYPMKDSSKYTEFEKRYPPDRFGEEASDNARVWKLYRDRVSGRDEDQIEGWNKTLDILLIFAGLFSAVATAFIIESYKQLQPDYTEYLAKAFIASLARTDSGSLPQSVPDLASFQRRALSRAVNTLWFLSLALALIAALFAILVKQWLSEYNSRMRRHISSHRRWAWRHSVFYTGIESWGLEGFISFLPVMLHAAMLLFLAGLVGFLTDIDWVIGGFISVLTVVAAVFYVGSTLAPLWYGDCPTATPLLRQGRRAFHKLYDTWNSTLLSAYHALMSRLGIGYSFGTGEKASARHPPAFDEDVLLVGNGPALDAKILEWMIISLPVAEEIDIALDAVGSLDPIEHQHLFHEEGPGVYGEPSHADPLCNNVIRSMTFSRFWRLSETWHAAEPAEVATTLRTMLFLCYSSYYDFAEQQRPHGVRQTVDVMFAFLERWMRHTTHDLPLLAMAVSQSLGLVFLDEVADSLAVWVDDKDQSHTTGQLPYLPSSLALAFLQPLRVRDGTAWLQIIKILCALMFPLGSSTLTIAEWRAVFSTVHSTVHLIMPMLPEPPYRSDYFDLMHTPEQARIRTLATLVAIMRDGEKLSPSGPLEDAARTFARHCPVGVAGLTMAHLKDVLAVVEYSKLRPDSEEAHNIAFLFSRFVAGVDFWSAEVGTAGRQLLANIVEVPQHAERMHIILPFLIGSDSCAVVAQHLAGKYSSATDAGRHSRVNILIADADERCCWDLLWSIDASHMEMALFPPTQALATHLCALRRSGLDVSAETQQLLGHNRGYRTLCGISYPPEAVRFAQHGRELSPEWWETTKARIQATLAEQRSWSLYHYVFPTAAEFVEHIDTLGPCSDCPTQLEFTGPTLKSPNMVIGQANSLSSRVLQYTQATPTAIARAFAPLRASRSSFDAAATSSPAPAEQV